MYVCDANLIQNKIIFFTVKRSKSITTGKLPLVHSYVHMNVPSAFFSF